MIRGSTFALAALLAIGGVAATALVARQARAGDDAPPLERAERFEREGRALIEKGHRVEGAKHMAEAWAIRARAWSQEERGAPERRIAELREASGALEREAHTLRDAGQNDAAEAKIAEAGRKWQEAEELAKRAKAARPEEGDAAALARKSADALRARASDLHANAAHLNEQRKALEAKAADLWAAGKESAAEETLTAAAKLREKAKALEASIEHAKEPALDAAKDSVARAKAVWERLSGAREGSTEKSIASLAEQVARLARQVEELRAAIEPLRKGSDAK